MPPEVTPEVIPRSCPEDKIPQIFPEVIKILKAVNGEMTRQEIMDYLSLKDEKHFREHYLKNAIAENLIEMTIADKPRSRNQKYRLTKRGYNILKSLDKRSESAEKDFEK